MKATWAHYTSEFLEHLLPTCCLLCGQSCPQRLICLPCEGDLPRIEKACRQCALPGSWGESQLCAGCVSHPPPWDNAVAGLVYEYPVDQLAQRFKFKKDMTAGRLLANELCRAIELSQEPQTNGRKAALPDVIIPVPLHFLRRSIRGYNQAEWIASDVQRYCGIPMKSGLLKRVRSTVAQSGLDRKKRLKNLKNSFYCHPLPDLHVALVDDVFTTGATLQECAGVLKKAGASRISVWVAARVPMPAINGRA